MSPAGPPARAPIHSGAASASNDRLHLKSYTASVDRYRGTMDLHFRSRQRSDEPTDPEPRARGFFGALLSRVLNVPLAVLPQRLFWSVEVLLLTGSVTAAASLSRASEWRPLLLVGLLLALVLGGHWLSVTIRIGQLNASLVALVLTMALLGPAPAVAFGCAAMILTSTLRRLTPAQGLNNLSTFACFLLVGGLMVRGLAGDVHDPRNQHLTRSVTFGLIVLAVFVTTVVINFLLMALDVRFDGGRSLASQVRDLFFPMLPGLLATGALATILAVAYTNSGLPVLFGAVLVLLIFQHLTVALLRSEDRADQLEARTIHLVSLQLGVLRTLVRALGMRDETTGRHSAAAARYAQELAKEVGCSQDEQDTLHTAGLLHDIGKFTWPDRVLNADVVAPEDQEIVKRHPQEGAELVGALDGYGQVADAILYHHERIDGGGYPAGLIGKEIPLGSRILAICCIYDTMTKRESYRPPMTPEEAMAELRVAAEHGQLDAELVESFIVMLERLGPEFAQGEHADFETELAFERRVREMAQPSPR
jgi:putative nucleotidyltransferase with HDIG domain